MSELYNTEIGYDGINYLMAQLSTIDDSDVPENTSETTYYSAKIAWGNLVGLIDNQTDLMLTLANLKDDLEEEINQKIASVLRYKGQVQHVSDLPTNASIGDVYNVIETDANYAWNGTKWDKLSETIDLSKYVLKTELDTRLSAFYTKVETDLFISNLTSLINQKADKTYVTELYNDLDGKITAEKTARETADTTLQGSITSVASDLSGYKTTVSSTYATKTELGTLDTKVDTIETTVDTAISEQDANIQIMLLKIAELEQKIEAVKSLDPEVVVLYDGGDTQFSNREKDFMLSGAITATTTAAGKSVTLKDATLTAASVGLLASQDIMVKDVTMTGSVFKRDSEYVICTDADGYITIKDCTLTPENIYNGFEVDRSICLAQSVTMDNLEIDGHVINHAISIYGMADNGVVTISNCHFTDVSNMLRLSNRTNTTWTVNIINCTVDSWDLGEYAGMIILQDNNSGSASAADTRDIFSKLTINIQNVTKPDGTKIVPVDLATICGTQDANQIIYMWDEWRLHTGYGAKYPTINIR